MVKQIYVHARPLCTKPSSTLLLSTLLQYIKDRLLPALGLNVGTGKDNTTCKIVHYEHNSYNTKLNDKRRTQTYIVYDHHKGIGIIVCDMEICRWLTQCTRTE